MCSKLKIPKYMNEIGFNEVESHLKNKSTEDTHFSPNKC